jgi:CubicO group peptidase (beta-lactamase class C family)
LQSVAIGSAAALRRSSALAIVHEPARLTGIDTYVESAMAKWEVPGLAIAVIQDDKLVHARGYGVREMGASAKVDVQTVFSLASCTKAFTAAAIARLVDDKQLQWDDPIAKHLPSFQLSDATRTETTTIRHALTHRTGLPAANMLWRSGAIGSDEILERLRWIEPVARPGERFLYNNNMYLVLGKVIEHVSGRIWADFVDSELFKPLGLNSTVALGSAIRALENVASPHSSDTGKVERIEPYCPDVIAPAGAIHTNVLDMAQWLKMHLSGGVCDGRRVLSKARVEEIHAAPARAASKLVTDPFLPRAPISNYGLGWFFNEYAGRKIVEHSGTQNGFVAWVAMMPAEQLGLVVLTNLHRTGLNYALRSWIFDACLGRPERDWSEIVRTDYANGYQRLLREAKAQFEANRLPAARPSLPLRSYTGVFESKLYGRIRVTSDDQGLHLQFGTRFVGKLEHWADDAFRVTFTNPRLDDWLVTFTIKDGVVTALHVKESPWAPAWYDDADDLGEFLRG